MFAHFVRELTALKCLWHFHTVRFRVCSLRSRALSPQMPAAFSHCSVKCLFALLTRLRWLVQGLFPDEFPEGEEGDYEGGDQGGGGYYPVIRLAFDDDTGKGPYTGYADKGVIQPYQGDG